MGSKNLPLQQKGIYHNLPTFSPDVKGLTAIVTGANGISGFHTMRVLLESPERWTKVYAISRRPPPPEMMDLLSAEHRSRVEHVACDFLSKPEEIAEALKGQIKSADVVFFYSYLQPNPEPGKGAWSNAQELCDVNSALLANFLDALPLAGLKPPRILLQTGAKNYGVHLGRARAPYVESDPRVTLEPNFYYPQEDILWKHCKANDASWNIVMPAWIIGAVNNASPPYGRFFTVYAAVQAHKNEPLHYPGDIEAWNGWQEHSSAMLTGYLSEWVALEDHTKNQKFNASDGCPIPVNRLWPELARWYGVSEVGRPELDESKYTIVDPGADAKTPLGFGPPTKSRFTFTLSHWAAQPENAKAWKEIMEKEKLTHNPFEDVEAHFTFGDAAAWGLALCLSTSKARYFGFTGYVDTLESLNSAYNELHKLGMLPPLKAKAQPLI